MKSIHFVLPVLEKSSKVRGLFIKLASGSVRFILPVLEKGFEIGTLFIKLMSGSAEHLSMQRLVLKGLWWFW